MSLNGFAAWKDADRHRMSVASHTAVPIGMAKWLGWRMQQTECPAVGRGHDGPYRLPTAGFPSLPIPFPAISVYLTADLYGWLLTSNAYGISLNRDNSTETNLQ